MLINSTLVCFLPPIATGFGFYPLRVRVLLEGDSVDCVSYISVTSLLNFKRKISNALNLVKFKL